LLVSRLAGSYYFEIDAARKAWNASDSEMSKTEKGYAYGRALSTILNYTI